MRRNAKGQLVPVMNHPVETATHAQLAAGAELIAKGLGAQPITPKTPNAELNATQGGRAWSGQIYAATPRLLRAFGITLHEINPDADFLTSGPGLAGFRVSDSTTDRVVNPSALRALRAQTHPRDVRLLRTVSRIR
jgi:hypothetical protein